MRGTTTCAILAGTTVSCLSIVVTSSSSLLHSIRKDAPNPSLFPTNHNLKEYAPIPPHFAQVANITSRGGVPTNAFWMNLITTEYQDEIQSIWTNPYRVKIQHLPLRPDFGLHLSYPYAHRVFGGQSHNGKMKEWYSHDITTDLILTALEFESDHDGSASFHVTSYSQNAVQVAFVLPSGASLTSSLVSGMAFVSATYSPTLTPVLKSPEARFVRHGESITLTSEGLVVALEGQSGKWIVYPEFVPGSTRASAHIHSHLIIFSKHVERLRVIRMPESPPPPSSSSSSQTPGQYYEALIRPYAACVVTDMILHVPSSARYGFEWKTVGDRCRATSGMLLHYALDHQLRTLNGSESVTALDLYSVRRHRCCSSFSSSSFADVLMC